MTSKFLNTSSRHGPSVYNVNEEKISPYHRGASLAALRTAIAGCLPLLLILLLAFTLRLLSARFLMGSIDSEGADYARIAENLLNGKGYVGIAVPGVELWHPPLFPLLIASVSLITHQSELAGRLISVSMGTLLVLPVYFITLHLYDRKVAYVAALLAACHPLLVGFASTVFSETTYMTFVLSGAYWSIRCLRLQTARAFVLAGGFFGLAYLTRQEATLYPFLTIAVLTGIALINRQQIRQIALRSCLLLSTFLILAIPFVVWLSAETGQFRWQAMSSITLPIAMPEIAGSNVDQVTLGISEELEDLGVYNKSNLSVIKSNKFSFRDIIYIAFANGLNELHKVPGTMSESFVSPLLVSLVALGLFGRPWQRALTISQCYLLFVILGVPCLALAGTYFVDTRHILLFLPVMIIWAANGIVLLSGWASATMQLADSEVRIAKRAGLAVGLTSAAILIMIATYGVRKVWDLTTFDYKSQPVKQAGRWLDALAPGPKTIMDGSTILAFHATASYVPFPYSDSSLALKYIEKKGINFIVLREEWLSPAPYIKDWLEDGVPDRRAQLIYSEKTQRGRILIYQWNANAVGRAHVASEIDRLSNQQWLLKSFDLKPLRSVTAAGPLKVNPVNRRYFTDGTGKSILLTGSHTWSNFQDAGRIQPPNDLDFETYLTFLRAHNHDFMRLWVWEQADWAPWRPYHYRFVPLPYSRPGPGDVLDGKLKFDLTKYDKSYFDRLRSRIIEAGKQGIYVSVMLFNGFSVERKSPNDWEDPWRGHPYNSSNNINGVNAGQGARGGGTSFHTLADPTIVGYQEDYVRKVVDTVNDLDNVLFEICNECNQNSTEWQYHIINFIKAYEATKPKQHPVGMTVTYPGGANDVVFASPADWVSINQEGGYDNNPPPTDGTKVILADTDHIFGTGGDRKWVWKSFLRGLNPVFMDPYDNSWTFPPRPPSEEPRWESIRRNMGYVLTYANRMDLSVMTPRGDLASSGFCLAGFEGSRGTFLIYLPHGGTTTVDLGGVPTEMSVEWLDPKTGVVASAGTVMGGSRQSFSPPFGDDAVLYIRSRTGDDVRRIQGAGYR
jgi:4-amino-4-deoxy-L-arabinose transferase-like glycosyltransferase